MMNLIRGIAALALVSVAGLAAAAGPFPNTTALNNYLHATYDGDCKFTSAQLDGGGFYRNTGVCGPLQSYNFFTCANGSINSNCNDGVVFESVDALRNYYAAQVASDPRLTVVYLNGAMFYSYQGAYGPARVGYYYNCRGAIRSSC